MKKVIKKVLQGWRWMQKENPSQCQLNVIIILNASILYDTVLNYTEVNVSIEQLFCPMQVTGDGFRMKPALTACRKPRYIYRHPITSIIDRTKQSWIILSGRKIRLRMHHDFECSKKRGKKSLRPSPGL